MRWIFLLVLMLCVNAQIAQFSPPTCDSRCQCTSFRLLRCTKKAYQNIPQPISFENIILRHQLFSGSQLTSRNFTVQPGTRLRSIKMDAYNKFVLHPHTFSHLSDLRTLDFSDSIELELKSQVFSGLLLNQLIMNSVSSLQINDDAFIGLRVSTLSMNYCHIRDLSVSLFKPIQSSLKHLSLEDNLLITLSPQFKPVFSNLQSLKLKGNRLFCNCSLKWLSEILLYKPSLYIKPVLCKTPSKLRNQPIHSIGHRITGCDPPSVSRIDINFLTRSQARISCLTSSSSSASSSPINKDVISWSSGDQDVFQNPLFINRDQQNSPIYICEARNPNGRTSLHIKFVWHPFSPTPRLSLATTTSLSLPTDSSRSASYFQKEVFTMFDMIFAIIGTLLITIGLFFVICCLLTLKHRNKLAGKRRAALKTYLSYDKGIYSETTHVVNANGNGIYCDTEMDRATLYPPPPSSSILPPFPPTYTLQY